MTSAITATGLRKSFGGTAVLDGIDLEVGAGTTFSLLGPNGARLLTGEENLLRSTPGRSGPPHAFLTPRPWACGDGSPSQAGRRHRARGRRRHRK